MKSFGMQKIIIVGSQNDVLDTTNTIVSGKDNTVDDITESAVFGTTNDISGVAFEGNPLSRLAAAMPQVDPDLVKRSLYATHNE